VPTHTPKPATTRRAQGAVFLTGALGYYAWMKVGNVPFYWTPLGIGLIYLIAAGAGGPRGGHWATGCVIATWGLGVVLLVELDLELRGVGVYIVALGLGALIAAALARRGFAVDVLGVAGAILAAGVLLLLEPELGAAGNPDVYAAGLALLGVVNLARS